MQLLPRAAFLASLPRKRVIASALIRDPEERVLCVDPAYKKSWHLPGGSVEEGESPSDACARECWEELGVAVQLGRLLAVGHLAPEHDDPHGALVFVYEASIGSIEATELSVPPEELDGVAYLDQGRRRELLSPLAQRLVDTGLEAVVGGHVVEFDREEA